MPLPAAWGTGIVRVIGLWNFLRLGSTVTIGDTATLLPSNLAVSSGEIGWAYKWGKKRIKQKRKIRKVSQINAFKLLASIVHEC